MLYSQTTNQYNKRNTFREIFKYFLNGRFLNEPKLSNKNSIFTVYLTHVGTVLNQNTDQSIKLTTKKKKTS